MMVRFIRKITNYLLKIFDAEDWFALFKLSREEKWYVADQFMKQRMGDDE